MRKLLLALAGAMLIWVNPVQASLIQVSAPVGWSCNTGSGGFEPGCTPEVERGVVTFTYDDSVIDSDPADDRGVFINSIQSFTMTVEQTTRPDLLFTLVSSPQNLLTTDWNVDAGAHHLRLSVLLAEEAGAVPVTRFSFNFLVCCSFTPIDDMPTIDNYWSRNVVGLIADGAAFELDWLAGNIMATTIDTAVPEPSAPLLLAAGLLALISTRRRRHK